MERLRVVSAPALEGRSWRALVWPVAFLLAATIAIGLARGELRTHSTATPGRSKAAGHSRPAHRHAGHTLYRVRAGDTVDGIATKTGVPEVRLLKLNPGISPTALFIGEKIRLR